MYSKWYAIIMLKTELSFMNTIPKHIAIIMDGNRRWAKEQGKLAMFGHSAGAKNLKRIIQKAIDLGVTHTTFWALSTENLKRDKKEVDHIFSLFEKITDYLGDFITHNAKFTIIGDISDKIPENVQKKLYDMVEKTKNADKMVITFAVNYGGRDEIVRATKKILNAGIDPETLSEETFATYLDTKELPNPDMIIRTGGNKRLSGYLPWQSTYAELYFTDIKWPAYSPEDLQDAVDWYANQQRNFGK